MTSEHTSLRILFVNRMASLVRGGGETFDLEVARHLAGLGCEITFLTGIPLSGKAKSELANNIQHPTSNIQHSADNLHLSESPTIQNPQSKIQNHHLRSPYLPWFPWDKVRGGWRVRVWEFQQFEKKAARWIIEHQDEFDIIQICELPFLVTLLKLKFQNPNSKIPKIVMRLTAPNAYDPWGGIQDADAVIASGTSINSIRKTVRPDVHDVPNAVDTKQFKMTRIAGGQGDEGAELRTEKFENQVSNFRQKHNIPESAIILLYVARFQAFKNHQLLLDAFARLDQKQPYYLVLVGSGPLMKHVESGARDLGVMDRVRFLGEVNFSDLPEVYAAADIKVISSEYESFCFAAIEAMASGLPVVSTDCGWVPHLLGDTLEPIEKQSVVAGGDPPVRFEHVEKGRMMRSVPGGLIVSRDDPASLANALQMMAQNAPLCATCGEWNRNKAVREHGWESSARKLKAVYEEILC